MRVVRRPCHAWLLAAAGIVAGLPLQAAETSALRAALNSITAGELGRHVDVLADDTFEGREAGSRGGRAAGGYLVQLLQENHIGAAGEDGGYFQSFGSGYRNILGMLEGRDPKLKNEFILICAHYDHVGYGTSRNSFGPTGYIHNGADDNASGTSGLVEVMQAFTLLPEPPRRSVLFAFWDGEEKGLLGSKHWSTSPTVPLEKVVMVLNADMIGHLRNDRVEIYGARTASGLRHLVSGQNTELGLQLDFMWDVRADSDHYTFFQRKIPFLMLHTGLHENYHRPSDDAELINQRGMQTVAQLMFRVAYELSEVDEVPSFRPASQSETNYARSQFERTLPTTPPRLGVSWSQDDKLDGLTLTRITPGSAADAAGLRSGDRIVEFDERLVTDGDQFRLVVLASGSPAEVVVARPGETEPVTLTVTLPGKPVRLGISWDQDRAEPSMVILTRVVPGSAAEQAGLAPKDRVYAIAGSSFADGSEFGRIVTSQSGPFEMLVERNGVLRTVTLKPLAQLPESPVSVDADTMPN